MLEPHVNSSNLLVLAARSYSSVLSSHLTCDASEAQAIIISCHASPVADRNRIKTACGNDWKLLFRLMVVPSSILILPNV